MILKDYINEEYKNRSPKYLNFCRDFEKKYGYVLDVASVSRLCNGQLKSLPFSKMRQIVEMTGGKVTYADLVENERI